MSTVGVNVFEGTCVGVVTGVFTIVDVGTTDVVIGVFTTVGVAVTGVFVDVTVIVGVIVTGVFVGVLAGAAPCRAMRTATSVVRFDMVRTRSPLALVDSVCVLATLPA